MDGKIADPSEGPQEGVKLSTWPRSPDCRDVNCHKCPGTAWDLERDQEVKCNCDCHPGYAPPARRKATLSTTPTGGSIIFGEMMEGAPVKLDGRTVGYVEGGLIAVTDEDALRLLNLGLGLELSIGPCSPIDPEYFIKDAAVEMMDYGKAVVDSIVDAANNPPPSRAERRHPKPDQCDPSKGYHSTPHVGCILR